jgi:hypothetical protein
MFIRDLKDCEEFTAGDNSILRELLHPIGLFHSKIHIIHIYEHIHKYHSKHCVFC